MQLPNLKLFAAVLLAVAALSSALTVQTSLDSASITSDTQGQAYVWAVNDFNAPATITFTASAAKLTATLDKSQHSAGVDGVAGTVVRFRAPPGFRGVDYITIQAQATTSSGSSVKASKRIEVRVEGARTAGGEEGTPSRFSKSQPSWGSVVQFGAAFDPSSYDVDLQSRTSCRKVSVGSHESERILLLNRGAAGSFDLRALGDRNILDAEVTPARVALQRSGAEEVWVRVSPRLDGAGQRTWVTFQVLAPNGQLVAERDLCFDLEDKYEAKLNVPRITQATNCAPAELKGVLQNTGTASDAYQVKGQRVLGVKPNDVVLGPGESQELQISIDTAGLAPGARKVRIDAVSRAGVGGSGETILDVKACEQVAQTTTQETAQPSNIQVSVEVRNEFDRPLTNLTASVEGLPASWEVLTPVEPINLLPGEARNISLVVKANTADEVKNATLVLREGNVVVARQRLPPLSGKPSGLTGFFIAASSNAWVIAAIVLVALAVLVMTGKLEDVKERLGIGNGGEGSEEREAYLQKLQNIRDQIERGERPAAQ